MHRSKGAFLVAQTVKVSACNAEHPGLIPGSGRSPGEGNGNPLQHSCLENSMDGGTSQATVHGVAKSWTRPSAFTFTFHRSKGHNVEWKKRKMHNVTFSMINTEVKI